MEEKIKKDKVLLKCLSSLLVIVVIIIGVSFAIFQSFARQTTTNQVGTLSCFTVSFEGVTSALNLTNEYPITDKEGFQKDPYVFKVTNNCTQYLTLNIGVETLSSSQIAANLIKGVITKNGFKPESASLLSAGKVLQAQNGGTAYSLLEDGIRPNQSKTYDLRLWFDENMTKAQGASKKYQGKVIVSATTSNPIVRNLKSSILADNIVSSPLTGFGENSADNEAVLATTTDDYGTSYYFRGAVTNNYVQFANMCWRIVRVTGNGAVKLVLYNYNGLTDSNATPTDSNPCATAVTKYNAFARFKGTTYYTSFNAGDSSLILPSGGAAYSDNAFVGFMYNITNGYASHENVYKSTILQNLELWYKNVLSKQSAFNETKLADVVWCNDKDSQGYQQAETIYPASERFDKSTPSLVCGENISRFTVDDTVNGNGALDYKIGLLTLDEAMFAGIHSSNESSKNYLYNNTNSGWWTMSPLEYYKLEPCMFAIDSLGTLVNSEEMGSGALRPSLALTSDVMVTGEGTSDDPYVVQ
ncbi:MAG: hypothetical protein Q4C33_03595 [bacterium]|nr:hypothetical protein [bacterium]